MTTLHVNTSHGYDIHIGTALLNSVGASLKLVAPKAQKAVILSDDNVYPLYGAEVEASLQKTGLSVCRYVIPHGEGSKSLETYAAFQEFLAEEQLTRSDVLVALGGGVVGDLCGFAAATYLRGIPYIQVPTSLLAMVDSSVGGKTAVDLKAGKNLCGAFYPPALVLCDTDVLSTLSDTFFADGMAEVIKYGMLYDAPLLALLQDRGKSFDREDVISRCIAHKICVVEADEFDRGERQKLNLGHTAAHGIERLSGYTIPHGHAVAAGLAVITRAAEKRGLCAAGTSRLLCDLLTAFDLPITTDFAPAALADAVLHDKKRSGGTVSWVVPVQAGHVVLQPFAVEESTAILADGI